MKLLTKEVEARIPKLYSTESLAGADKVAVAKFFFPSGRYTFYVVEGEREGDDFRFFGWCVSALGPDCDEWGYTNLSELESVKTRGLTMERDTSFKPTKMSELFPTIS